MDESSWRRAWRNTESAQKSARFMWVGEAVLAVAGSALAGVLAPNGLISIFWVVLGGLAGLSVTFIAIFAFNVVHVPYQQRDEARSERDRRETELQTLRDQKARIASLRQRVNGYIQQGTLIANTLRTEMGKLLPQGLDDAWVAEVREFVSREFPDYLGYFMSDAGFAFEGVLEGPPLRSNRYFYIQHRIARLGELLKDRLRD